MKPIILCITFLFSIHSFAQFETTVSAPNAEASISTNGNLFWKNSTESGFHVLENSESDQPVGTLYAGSLWLGAKTSDQSFASAVNYYFDVNYAPGPQDYLGNFNFDMIWKVSGNDILDFQLDFSDGTIDDEIPESILHWPARNNPHLSPSLPIGNFAPFYDENGDGVYNPIDGDYPIVSEEQSSVIPHDLAYTILHDEDNDGNPLLGVNMHVTMYSIACDEIPALEQAIFTHHRIENVSTSTFEEFYVGVWLDYDLGCYIDDYFGCSPINNMSYAYNQFPEDGTNGECTGIGTFGSNPAVHGTKYLNNDMSSSIHFNRASAGNHPPGTWDPETASEYQHVLEGKWRDGLPLTYGGSGYNIASTDVVSHIFPGDPTDISEWSMANTDIGLGDIRTFSTSQIGSLSPGQSVNFDMVQMVTIDESYDYLEKIAVNITEMQAIQAAYDNGFNNQCTFSVGTKKTPYLNASFSIAPNPNVSSFRVTSDVSIDKLTIYDLQGRNVSETVVEGNTIDVNHTLESGVYFVQLQQENTVTLAKKMVVVH